MINEGAPSRRSRVKGLLAMAGLLPMVASAVTACTAAAPYVVAATQPPSASDLSFAYVGDPTVADTMNQVLTIRNASAVSLVPTLAITPLDQDGQVVTGVSVGTVFGSDHGAVVVAPGKSGGAIDILRFSGAHSASVAKVAVKVTSVVRATDPAGRKLVTVQPADSDGRSLTKFDRFQEVVLTNPNGYQVSVRIVYIVWDQPTDPSLDQQASAVVPIGGLVVVPAGGSVTVPVTGDAQKAVAEYANGPAISLKTYFSH